MLINETIKKYGVLIAAFTASIVCLIVYLKALDCGFVFWDDPDYVTNNFSIRHLDSDFIIEAFTRPISYWWMPLTWFSLAVDYYLWGLNPFGYHLTNILLHSINSGLVVLIANQIIKNKYPQKGQSNCIYMAVLLLAGLLWGIHPLRVESVAWVTERKDVLNGLFSLSSILFYLLYVQNKLTKKYSFLTYYLPSLVFFAMSLMSKSVSVLLPLMLLVADWYPLRRVRSERVIAIFVDKIPFLLLSILISVVTVAIANQRNILISSQDLSFGLRVIISGNAIFEYSRLLVYPVDIHPFYLIPNPVPYPFLVKSVIVICFCGYCIYQHKRRPWQLATLCCYILPLLPVLSFIQNGKQALASRFTYLPSVAPVILLAAGIGIAFDKMSTPKYRYHRSILFVAVFLLLLFHVNISLRLIDVWQNTGTMWSRVILIQPIGRAYQERGLYYFSEKKYDLAVEDLTHAIDTAFELGIYDKYNLNAFRGEALREVKRYEEAVDDFTFAIHKAPRPVYFYHRGLALKAMGRIEEANEDFMRAGTETGSIDWY